MIAWGHGYSEGTKYHGRAMSDNLTNTLVAFIVLLYSSVPTNRSNVYLDWNDASAMQGIDGLYNVETHDSIRSIDVRLIRRSRCGDRYSVMGHNFANEQGTGLCGLSRGFSKDCTLKAILYLSRRDARYNGGGRVSGA